MIKKDRRERKYVILAEGCYSGHTALILKKAERQLVLYKYLSSGKLLEKDKVLKLYGIPTSTIYKDLQDLSDAGIITLKYNPLEDWYDVVEDTPLPEESTLTPNRMHHLLRLRRLTWCMRFLENDPADLSCDDTGKIIAVTPGKRSCRDYYHEKFPNESVRTMNRDFEALSNIGYIVKYNRRLGRYDFFIDEMDWEDYPWVPGVVYSKAHGLCHVIDENMELQDNLFYETMNLRMGLPEDEWIDVE